MDYEEFERRAMAAGRDHAGWVRRNLADAAVELEALDGALRGEGYGSCSAEGAGELGEDRQVGVQPNAIQPTDAKRGERPFMLEATELAFNGGTATEERGVARDQGAGGKP